MKPAAFFISPRKRHPDCNCNAATKRILFSLQGTSKCSLHFRAHPYSNLGSRPERSISCSIDIRTRAQTPLQSSLPIPSPQAPRHPTSTHSKGKQTRHPPNPRQKPKPQNHTTMASRIPSMLRSAAFARPATSFAQTAALQQSRRSFQTSQRMLQDVAPVRKPVGAFRGT